MSLSPDKITTGICFFSAFLASDAKVVFNFFEDVEAPSEEDIKQSEIEEAENAEKEIQQSEEQIADDDE